jgi:hypothetical protein
MGKSAYFIFPMSPLPSYLPGEVGQKTATRGREKCEIRCAEAAPSGRNEKELDNRYR